MKRRCRGAGSHRDQSRSVRHLRWVTGLAAGLLAFVVSSALWAQEAPLSFNWAFVRQGPDGSPTPIDFHEKVSISPGDLFKVYVQPVSNAFVYLFLHDAQGDLQLLFPDQFSVFDSRAYLDGRYFIPTGENWFALDGARGVERFYLVASSVRLKKLESLVGAYLASTDKTRPAARQAVLDEIARLRKEHSQLTMAAEKPVTIAGGPRGVGPAVQKAATRIDAPGFYYKLFRLEH